MRGEGRRAAGGSLSRLLPPVTLESLMAVVGEGSSAELSYLPELTGHFNRDFSESESS